MFATDITLYYLQAIIRLADLLGDVSLQILEKVTIRGTGYDFSGRVY